MTKFIVISGRKQVGKDTVARRLDDYFEAHDIKTTTTYFAEPLKKLCNNLFGIPFELLYGTDEQKNMPTDVMWDTFDVSIRLKYAIKTEIERVDPAGCWHDKSVPILRSGPMTTREVLQVIGTDIFRKMVDDDIWAKAPFRKDWVSKTVLIPDCRFPNEVEHSVKNNAIIIRINRDTGLIDYHESESVLDDYNWNDHITIDNNSTLDDLYIIVDKLAEDIINNE